MLHKGQGEAGLICFIFAGNLNRKRRFIWNEVSSMVLGLL